MNGSLPDPFLPHTMVKIVREHLCRFEVILMKSHLTEVEYVVFGHIPQFEVLTKYCTPDTFVATESHVKVRWSVLISVSVIFGGGKTSIIILLLCKILLTYIIIILYREGACMYAY